MEDCKSSRLAPLSEETREWFEALNFKQVSGSILIEGKLQRYLSETERSVEVAREIANRLNMAKARDIKLEPYNKKKELTASVLSEPEKAVDLDRAEDLGFQEIVEGHPMERGMAIDAALFQCDFTTDGLLSEAEEVTVDLQSLGISVMGHPDAIAFECPVELKTITTFEPSSYHRPGEKPILGFEKKKGPLWNLEKYLMQLGMYQIAMGGSGFLALVSRESGSVVCFETESTLAGSTITDYVEGRHTNWIDDDSSFRPRWMTSRLFRMAVRRIDRGASRCKSNSEIA